MRRRLFPAAQAVLDAALGRLGEVPSRVFLQPGAVVAWDVCPGKQLAVRVIRVTPRMPPPGTPGSRTAGPDPMSAMSGWVARMGVQLVMCVATVNDQGKPPSPSVLTSEAEQIFDDAELIRLGLMCDLDYRCMVVQWTPLGPQGGVAGGEWEIEIDL